MAQEPVLFAGSVLANIRYGRPEAEEEAARAAAAAYDADEEEFVTPKNEFVRQFGRTVDENLETVLMEKSTG